MIALERYGRHLERKKVNINIQNMFEINNILLLQILGTIISYAIILYSFEK